MFAAAVVVLASCGDDDDKAPANYVTYDGTTKGIVTVFSLQVDEDTDAAGKKVYTHDMTFVDASMDNSNSTATVSGFDVLLYSSEKTLTDGTYTIFTGKGEVKPNQASEGVVYLDAKYDDSGEATAGKEYEVISGSATLKKSGESYTFDFTGKAVAKGAAASTAKDVKVHYSGEFLGL